MQLGEPAIDLIAATWQWSWDLALDAISGHHIWECLCALAGGI